MTDRPDQWYQDALQRKYEAVNRGIALATLGIILYRIAIILLLLWIAWHASPARAEGHHRGINMDVNRTGYHMIVVIEDPKSHGKHVSIIDDKTAEECANAAAVLKQHVPEAWVCCYHTPDQAKGC